MKQLKKIVIDGIQGTGKKTVINHLIKKYSSSIEIINKSLLRPQFTIHWDNWLNKLEDEIDYYIILESSPSSCLQRKPSITISSHQLFYERYKYRQLACFYKNMHLIDTDLLSIDTVISIIEAIIHNNNNEYAIPVIDSLTSDDFNQMQLVIDTNSKIVRKYNNKYHIVELKPNVYSFALKGVHCIPETDIERVKLTKDFIELLSREEVPHSYYYVGNKYILNKSLYNDIDLPPIETIVKKFCIGSDKHNYFNLSTLLTRHKTPVCSSNSEYNSLMVRFDYRNPEYNPKTGQVLGDITLCDDLADQLINVAKTKELVKKAFNVLRKHLNNMSLEFYDMCAFVTINGDMIYGEISQDCTKIRPLIEDNLKEEEKIIWRSGGSSSEQNVLSKYKFLTQISHTYTKELFNSSQ